MTYDLTLERLIYAPPEVVFDSRKPLPQDSGVEANTHVHGNWVFTTPGTYLIEVEMSATEENKHLHATLHVNTSPSRIDAGFTRAEGKTKTTTVSR